MSVLTGRQGRRVRKQDYHVIKQRPVDMLRLHQRSTMRSRMPLENTDVLQRSPSSPTSSRTAMSTLRRSLQSAPIHSKVPVRIRQDHRRRHYGAGRH